MGYNLTIGEAFVSWSEDRVCVDAESVKLDDAPAFGEMTDYTSERCPGYSTWANFCRSLDIVDLMFNELNGGSGELEFKGKFIYPLIGNHPGASPITALHVEFLEHKLAAYKVNHPDHIACYPPLKEGVKESFCNAEEDYVLDEKYDGNLCRAEWLLFWLRWAVANCKQPVFVNT